MTPEEARAALQAVGDRIRAAEAERAAAMAELRELAKEVHHTVPIKQIAELGGVTRPTVYKLLEA